MANPQLASPTRIVEDGGHALDSAQAFAAAFCARCRYWLVRQRKLLKMVRRFRRASFLVEAARLVNEVFPPLVVSSPLPLPDFDDALPLPSSLRVPDSCVCPPLTG